MKHENERKIEMVELDLDLTIDECKTLREYGLKLIKDDEAALIDYAVNKILRDVVKDTTLTNEVLRKAGELNGKC